MQRAVLVVAAMVVLLLSGCLGIFEQEDEPRVTPPDVGYDAAAVTVSDVEVHDVTIPSFDGTELSAVIYQPIPQDALPGGDEPPFPVVVFLHGWGFAKEMWQNAPMEGDAPAPVPPTDLLDEFARAGMIAVAYDARGFGQSGGQVHAAHFQEMADLDAVVDYVEDRFHTNRQVGVTGISYGGGQAMLAWADNSRVTTAVPHQGWTDLYEALVPGNVPKLQWMQMLYAEGAATSGGRLAPDIHEWYLQGYLRDDPDGVRADMDRRSILDAAARTDKPLMTCQGMHESLFTQSQNAWATAPGFVHAVYHDGGHGRLDRDCWDKTRDWFRFFLAGIDTGIASWPTLETVDAAGGDAKRFGAVPSATAQNLYLRPPGSLTDYNTSSATFDVQQMVLANPFTEPSVLWDLTGMPYQTIPAELRQDPSAMFFASSPFEGSEVLLGAPTLTLHATPETASGPYQVAATLYLDSADGMLMLGRTAYAVLDDSHHDNGTIVLEFPWVKADIHPEDALVLKVGANDPSAFMPLMSDYTVTFTGDSSLAVPLFAP